MQSASDEEILMLAAQEKRVIISADTDFGTLLALRFNRFPSFVLLRRQHKTTLEQTAALLVDILPRISTELTSGAVVVVTDDRLRIRTLPVSSD